MPTALIVCSLVALIATLSVTEMVRVCAHRLSAVDRPGGRRVHRRPTARLGGLGIYWGFYVALGLATYGHSAWSETFRGDDPGMIGMMVGSSLLLIVGVMDDVYGLKATLKLGFQIVAALLLYGSGWRIESVGLPGVGSLAVGPLSLPLTVGWMLLVTNAVNLIDGLDGLACGVALVATLAICALMGHSGGPLTIAAAALAGALLGFLWFNLNPALIFMGDAGSLFVGYVLAAMTLRAGQIASPVSFPLVSVLVLSVPLFDTGFAIVRRAWATARSATSVLQFLREVKGRVFEPDGNHLHHQLIRAGWTTRGAVAVLWVVAATFALAGWLLLTDPILGAFLMLVAAGLSWRGFHAVRMRIECSQPTLRSVSPSQAALIPTESPEAQDSARRAA